MSSSLSFSFHSLSGHIKKIALEEEEESRQIEGEREKEREIWT